MPRRRSALVDRLVVGQPGAIEADQSDAVVLGCAGMADSAVTSRASWACPSWTVSPAATLTVQSLVTMGLRTSNEGVRTPPVKSYWPAG